jgi:hypothetical protein
MLRGLLAAEGCKIGRRHVKTLMRRMVEALTAVRAPPNVSPGTRSIRICYMAWRSPARTKSG